MILGRGGTTVGLIADYARRKPGGKHAVKARYARARHARADPTGEGRHVAAASPATPIAGEVWTAPPGGPLTTAATAPDDAGIRTSARLRPALIWSYVMTTGGSLAGSLLQIGLVAVLDPRSFGMMVLAMIWVTLAIMLLTHGPTLAVIQQDGLTGEHFDAAFWITMAGTVGYAALVAAFAPAWAAINHVPELPPVLWALLPCILLTGLVAVPDAVMRRRLLMRSVAARSLSGTILGGLAGLGCALAGLGVWALVVQQLTAATVFTILLWVVAPWRPGRPRPGRIRRAWRDIRATSVHTLTGAVGNFVSTRVDGLIMGMFFAPFAIGLYRFGGRFAEMALDLTSRGLEQVALPELARYKDDPDRFTERLGRLVHVGTVLALPSLAVLAVAGQPLVVMLGPDWAQAASVLPVLCAMSAVGLVTNLLVPALQAADRPGIPAAFTWVGAALYTAGFVAAASLTAGHPPVARLVTVIGAMLALRAAVAATMAYVTYRRVLRVSVRPTLAAAAPAALAALCALLAGWVARGAAVHLPASGQFVVVATAASASAGLGLLGVDARVRGWALAALRRSWQVVAG